MSGNANSTPKPRQANDERTPLINGSSSPHDDGGDENHYPTQSSDTMVFLFNSEHTPGKDSSNIAIRAAAHCWHATKVTLLSSEFLRREPKLPEIPSIRC